MTLLAVERIKLFSTRSPYWCLAIILAVAVVFALVMGLVDGGRDADPLTSQGGIQLGLMVMMVLAALSVTTEYRFNTMKATFVAAPHRLRVFAAKTALLVGLAAVVGAVASLGAFYLTKVLSPAPDEPMTLATGENARVVLGNIALFAVTAVIAVAVGALMRHSAGGIATLLVWSLLLANLVSLIPKVGHHIAMWLPFKAASMFVLPSHRGPLGEIVKGRIGGPTPVEGLLIFLATAVVLWAAAAYTLARRDA